MMIPFKADHFDLFTPREQDRAMLDELALALGVPVRAAMADLARKSIGGGIVYDGRLIGIVGFLEVAPRQFMGWAFPSIYVTQYPLAYLRTTKQYMEFLERDWNPIGVYTTSAEARWMKFLGFSEADADTPFADIFQVASPGATIWSKTY